MGDAVREFLRFLAKRLPIVGILPWTSPLPSTVSRAASWGYRVQVPATTPRNHSILITVARQSQPFFPPAVVSAVPMGRYRAWPASRRLASRGAVALRFGVFAELS